MFLGVNIQIKKIVLPLRTLRSPRRSLWRSLGLCGEKIFGLFAFGIILLSPCLSAKADSNTVNQQIQQLSEGIQRHQLDNGLICLIKEDFTAPLVSIQIWVASGSAQEGEYLGGGLSHLIEHMIFKGTPKRKPADISKEIDDAGGSINAYTTLDRTVFWVDMPAERWQTGLDVLADAVMRASFPEDEWRREKDVIRREMAMGNDNPDRVLSKLLWQTAYLVHPYRFPVIGREEIFNTLARADLLAFFRRHYTPDNMIVAIAGNVDAPSVRAAVESRFRSGGANPQGEPLFIRWLDQRPCPTFLKFLCNEEFRCRARPLPAQTVEPPQLSPRIERKTGAYNISRLEMAWHTVGLSHPDAPALDILSIIAGGGKSSRLGQKIKENRKLAFSIDAWSYTPKDAGLFGISAAFDPAKEDELIKAIETEIADWRRGSMDGNSKIVAGGADPGPACAEAASAGRPASTRPATVVSGRAQARPLHSFPLAEVDKARNKITADTLLAFQTMHGKADTFASGEFYAGTPAYFNTYLKRLAEVTPESLRTVADRYLNDNNRTLVILSPGVTNESNSMHGNFPPQADSPAAEKFVAGVADPGPACAEAASAGRPASTRPATEINIVKKNLPNGLTLLCREDRRLPFVDFCIVAQGGLLMENEKNSGSTCLMAELLTRGTETFSQEEIAETIESSGGSFSSFSGMNSYGLQARCFSKDAELFMDILADCRLGPVFSEEEIAKSKVIQIARIEQQRESPFFLGQEAMRKALFAGHPYSLNVEGTRESVMAITREELCRLHSETTGGSNSVLAVFGDISAVKAVEIAEKFMGKMAAGRRQDFLGVSFPTCPPRTDRESRKRPDILDSRFHGNDRERKRQIELTAPREQTIVLAGFPGFAVTDERIDALDIVLNALNGLSSDLMINVRDKKGLAYYTGAYHRSGIVGGQFVVYSGTRAEEAVHVQEMIIKEVSRIAGKGLRADEFERAKRQIMVEHRQNLQVNAGIAMECALDELYGRGYSRSLETEKRLGKLSPDDVRKAAAEILCQGKMITVIVKPEK